MPLDDTAFETFWKSHQMCRALAQCAIDLMQELTCDFYNRPPLTDARLEKFRQSMRRTYDATFPDKARPARPTLKVMN